jgi:hypothetical protein
MILLHAENNSSLRANSNLKEKLRLVAKIRFSEAPVSGGDTA